MAPRVESMVRIQPDIAPRRASSWRQGWRDAWGGGLALFGAGMALGWGGMRGWAVASALSLLSVPLLLWRWDTRSSRGLHLIAGGGVLGFAATVWTSTSESAAAAAAWGAWVGACTLALRLGIERYAREPIDVAAARLAAAPGGHLRPEESSSAGVEPFVPVSAARAGDRIVVRGGEVVPLDGVVDQGSGEALLHPTAVCSQPRRPGQPLLAGARLLSGEVRVLVTRVGGDRGLSRALRFGENPPEQVRRLPWRLVWEPVWLGATVCGGALLAFVLYGGGVDGLAHASAVLLATPMLGLFRATRDPWRVAAVAGAEHGIVFRDEETLERAGRVRRVALARRGVVTVGEPVVVEVRPLDSAWKADELLALAAGLEQVAEGDPIARAIVSHARERNVVPCPVRRARVVPARGVAGIGPGGEPVAFGNRQLLISEGVGGALADEAIAEVERRGDTALLLASGGRVRGIVALHDELSPWIRPAVQRFFDMGAEVVLLSGDHRGTLERQAHAMGVLHVEAELTPDERGDAVERLVGGGGTVGAVGRSPEHDPILLKADVPAVLDGAGAPAGDRGVGLTTGDPRQAALAFWLAWRATRASRRGMLAGAAIGAVLTASLVLGVAPPLAGVVVGTVVDVVLLPTGSRLYWRARRRLGELAGTASRVGAAYR